MAPIKCNEEGCTYVTKDFSSEELVFRLLSAHKRSKHNIDPDLGVSNSQNQEKAEKIDKPNIKIGITLEEWLFLMNEWSNYKVLSKPSKQNISRILLQCCEVELRKNLYCIYGSLGSQSEEYVLKVIKEHAVQSENIVVARVTLHEMKQDQDETVRSLLARLKGQARLCNYSVKFKPTCGNCGDEEQEYDVDYTDIQVRDVLVCSLADNEIRTDILGDMNQDMSLEKMFQLIEAKEMGKKSATQLSNPHKVSAVKSSYKRETKTPQSKNIHPKNDYKWDHARKPKSRPCNWCGNHGHGNIRDFETRTKNCPAFNHTCKICNIKHHFEKACRGRKNPQLHMTSTSNINADYNDSSFEMEDQVGAIRQHSTYQQD